MTNFLFFLNFYIHFRFLDFGLLCQMEKKHQFAMLASIMHIVNGDWGSLVNDLTLMDVVRPGPNLRRVTMVSQLDEQLLSLFFYKYLSFHSNKVFLKWNIRSLPDPVAFSKGVITLHFCMVNSSKFDGS